MLEAVEAVEAAIETEKAVAKFRKMMLCALITLAVLAAAAFFIYRWGYNGGYNSADTKWVASHNKEVEALNAKIAALEKSSRDEAGTLRAQVMELKAKLDKTPVKTIVLHDSAGKVMQCEGKDVVPYLGSDFTDAWNKYNEEGAMK